MIDAQSLSSAVLPEVRMQQTASGLPEGIRACVVGGRRIPRAALAEYLETRGVVVAGRFGDGRELREAADGEAAPECDVMVLLVSGGTFAAFHQMQDAMSHPRFQGVPMVVLADQVARGKVYAALRAGAKAYVSLDAEPSEALRAVAAAADDKVYLSPDAAALLVQDVSTAIEPSQNQRLPDVRLSKREVEIVQLLCDGLSSKQIAQRLHISPKTVENHRYNIYRKAEVEGLAGLMRHAIQHGLISI